MFVRLFFFTLKLASVSHKNYRYLGTETGKPAWTLALQVSFPCGYWKFNGYFGQKLQKPSIISTRHAHRNDTNQGNNHGTSLPTLHGTDLGTA